MGAAAMMETRKLRRNDITALLLVVLVSLAPIPLGSNRPALWAITDTLVILAFLAQAVMRVFDESERSRFLPRSPWLLGLFAVVALWQAIQIAPLGFALAGVDRGIGDIGATISLVPGQTLLMLLNFLSYGIVFILAYQIGQRPGRAKRIYVWAGYMTGAFALYALYNYTSADNALLGLPREFYIGDAAGTFVNRNSFATFLGLGLVVNAGLVSDAVFGALSEGRRIDRLSASVHAMLAAVLLAGLFATHSRMGLFAALVGAFATVLFFWLRAGNKTRISLAGMVVAVFGAGTIAVFYGQGVLERLGSTQSSFDVRFELYVQAVELALVRPLVGFGAGTFEAAFPLVHHLPVSPDLIWDKAHNTYLTLLVELGLPVGCLAILIVPVMLPRLFGGLKLGSVARLGGVIGIGATLQVALHSLVDFSLEIHAVALLYAFLLGLGRATTAASTRARL